MSGLAMSTRSVIDSFDSLVKGVSEVNQRLVVQDESGGPLNS